MSCNAHQPIEKRSWINFKDVKTPEYDSNRMVDSYSILNTTTIDIEEQPSVLSHMIHKTTKDFQKHLDAYATTMKKRIKHANNANSDYGFVRKPELRHQYGMLFNHHGQVISGLKNIDLFLSVDLPKVEDIAHIPPEFPDCDTWAAPHKSQKLAPRTTQYLDLERMDKDLWHSSMTIQLISWQNHYTLQYVTNTNSNTRTYYDELKRLRET